jgi:hypothetical protein
VPGSGATRIDFLGRGRGGSEFGKNKQVFDGDEEIRLS